MKYFAVFLPMKNEEKSQQYRAQHLDFLNQKRQEGKIFANGRFADEAGGLVIYRAGSLEEVEQIAKQDPYVIQGARGFDIHEWEMVSDAVLPY
ncbi:YciI family protein [Domibacillus robiginosus]|uniref:YciI family protein n=1 Tax=Domibacillus robiginosus TaxID=1071054 RepID=UPI00067E16F6|nr:YciI family protein [Domibacillus robiginosus]